MGLSLGNGLGPWVEKPTLDIWLLVRFFSVPLWPISDIATIDFLLREPKNIGHSRDLPIPYPSTFYAS